MTTILQARPRQFVSTPAIDRVASRALRYLQSGYSIHLRGPAGTGKTTMALHLADLLGRPIMLLFGDDEFKTSDLIGNQTGYTRKKVFDNFIHSVVKVEDELRQNWVDSRLTLACREGFTLVYDEFNRSRPEVNNVLLSALEEKLLVLPPNGNRPEYVRVNPHFRAIFTSNPAEYCGVHATQDALLDRLITMNMPEPDVLTQQEILTQKIGVSREDAHLIVQLVKAFREATGAKDSSGLRSCLMLSKVCHEHDIPILAASEDFRDVCQDVLLARSNLPWHEAQQLLWQLCNAFIREEGHAFAETPIHLDRLPSEVAQSGGVGETEQASTPLESLSWDEFDAKLDTNLSTNPENRAENSLTADRLAIAPPSPQLGEETGESEAWPEALADGNSDVVAGAGDWPALDKDAPVAAEMDAGNGADHEALDAVFHNDRIDDTLLIHRHTAETTSEPTPPSQDQSAADEASEALEEEAIADDSLTVVTFTPGEAISEADRAEAEMVADTIPFADGAPYEREIYAYLLQYRDVRPSQIEAALGITRLQTVSALRSLSDRGLLDQFQADSPLPVTDHPNAGGE
ncbi:MAG: gas vesicle protein GvpN [Synechococcales bacterium]|nr:gas vesicle protein GvpN [Synechococcales bacterium]